MLFPTTTFAIFFTLVLAGSCVLGDRPVARKLGLIVASGIFYAWWDGRFVALLAAVILGTHLVALAMDRWPRHRTAIGALGVVANLAVLGFFKYYDFFRTSLTDALEPFGLDPSPPLLRVLLPVGLSFYIFEAIAYLVEVRRGTARRLPLLDLAACLSFFPKLFSGPITRPSELAPQLAAPPATVETTRATWLIARGLVKKMVVATYLGDALVDSVFATPSQHDALEVVVGIYAYTAQIYIDFSAYTDMAIGLALLLGVRLPENFNAPYTARSVQQFWTRWHMTLGRWFRDIVFAPLARRGSPGTLATSGNIMIVMLLTGLWHGAGWAFVVWGGLHGVAMVAARAQRDRRRARGVQRRQRTLGRTVAAQVATFHFVAITWVLFRAGSISGAGDVIARLDDWGPSEELSPLLVATIIAALGAQFLPQGWTGYLRRRFQEAHVALQVVGLSGAVFIADALGPEGVAPFIYFGF